MTIQNQYIDHAVNFNLHPMGEDLLIEGCIFVHDGDEAALTIGSCSTFGRFLFTQLPSARVVDNLFLNNDFSWLSEKCAEQSDV